MVNITYLAFAKGTQALTASTVVESYQAFWRSKSETNSSRRVTITGLNFADSSSKRSVLRWSDFGRSLFSNLLEALMALAGVLCFALLARNPARLQIIPLCAVPYLIALGIGRVGDELEVRTPTASAVVRIWPSDTEGSEPAAEASPDARLPMLHRERERAWSDEVLDETMRALAENPVMTQSGHKDRWQTRAWLKEHLEAIAIEDTFLLIFRAAHDDAAVAVGLANAGAKAYCQVRSSGADKLEAEVFDRASSAVAKRNPNPLKASLSSTTSSALFFLLGTGLAYGGYVFERVRRSKTAGIRSL